MMINSCIILLAGKIESIIIAGIIPKIEVQPCRPWLDRMDQIDYKGQGFGKSFQLSKI
jgi:hypothetical protein